MKFLIAELLFFGAFFVFGQSVELAIKSEYFKQNTFLEVSSFYEGNTNVPLYWNDSITVTKGVGGRFKLPIKTKGTIEIKDKGNFQSMLLFLEPGDKLVFHDFEKDKDAYFEGSNELGHNYVYYSPIYYSKETFNDLIDQMKTVSSLTIANEKLENYFVNHTNKLDSLLKVKSITNGFYELAIKNAEIQFLNSVDIISNTLEAGHYKTVLSPNKWLEVKKYWHNKFNVFDERYSVNLFSIRKLVIEERLRMITKGQLKSNIYHSKLYSNSIFSNLPTNLQQTYYAFNLIVDNYYQQTTLDERRKEYKKLRDSSPDNPYIKYLFQLLYINEIKSRNLKGVLYYYKDDKLKIINSSKKIENIESLIKNTFEYTGKSYILVDIWATWCGPCIREFDYLNDKKLALLKNNIEVLYVSIDKEAASNKWEEMIVKNNLKGFHFLGSNEIEASIEKYLDLEQDLRIPRYLLFSKDGNLINGNLPLPSSGDFLKTIEDGLINK